ncbi:MAG: ATP-binding protein [Gammaproteobacteria bacterium]|jgi:signal transduction histidine kinase
MGSLQGRLLIAVSAVHAGVVIEVEDNGPEIPTAKLHSVLRRGMHAHPDTASHGIGLAVVREIVEEIYRGDITVDRGSLGGTRVRVQFPG